MTIYFTSDLHLNHQRILLYEPDSRPFPNTEEMDKALIANWNSIVSPGDTVYLLGDFMMGQRDGAAMYRQQLNGKIHLILGNHDLDKHRRPHKQIFDAGFDSISTHKNVVVQNYSLLLRHVPDMDFTPGMPHDYHICGHVHASWSRVGRIINCGVDIHGLKPVTIEQLIATPEYKGRSHRGY